MDRRPQLPHFATAGGWVVWVWPIPAQGWQCSEAWGLGLVELTVSHSVCVYRSSPRCRVRDNPSHDMKSLMLGLGTLLFHSHQCLALRVGLAPPGPGC